jgi:DNA-binding transcriptional MerR regulator
MKGEDRSELLSGELAARAGVSKDTLRFYERRRLLPQPRRAGNGYRRYPSSALGRVRMIRAALSIGFTVDELSSILAVREAGGAPCRQVRQLAGEKLARLGAELASLTRFRADLERVLADWDGRLKAARGRRAGLLEALAGIDSPLRGDRGHGSRVSRDLLPGRKG